MEVDIADNGRIAVERILRAPTHWDLVLMDMQMPVLDGVSATEEIRNILGVDLPVIVAMTANAMPQHVKRCMDAGMQGFIPKPIDPEQLWSTLIQWIAPRDTATAQHPPVLQATALDAAPSLPHDIAGLDVAQGLRRVLGKEASYLKMLRKFMSNQCNAIQQVRQALSQGDWLCAERAAHTLKGVAGNIGATRIQADADALESALNKKATLHQVDALTRRTEQSLTDLLDALNRQLPGVAAIAPALAVDAGQLQALVDQLTRLLNDDDASALDVFGDNTALLQFAYPACFKEMEEALMGYEFASALEYLQTGPH
jgi:two-component system sensor histidine kinase/response regulator